MNASHPQHPAVVLIPVKAFDRAKGRLADVLDAHERASLAEATAQVVLAAAAPLRAVVVCDDDEVARWAGEQGADVEWTPGLDLNEALGSAIGSARGAGVRRVVIAHADLPFATDLARFAELEPQQVVIVADRHRSGTNVMSLPTEPPMELRYGDGSCAAHQAAALAAGLEPVVVHDEALAWDIDEPADLDPPAGLGRIGGAPDFAISTDPG